jgi:UDP-N-acetylmuramate: L-alanyl-gamma-D-glutamyl-meso-diaminopimelate ligase
MYLLFMKNIENINKVHFIGICGAGMSAVAKLCLDMGMQVTGSDAGFYSPISDYLVENKIPFIDGFRKENIKEDIDVIVIGKHASLTEEENEEVRYAFELKEKGMIQIMSFAELLNTITAGRENIVCVGSYGKSTATSLLSHVMSEVIGDIGYFIGAAPFTPKTNAHVGTHKNFILEGDEYPSANFDSTSKFIHYNANDILLTSLSHDHVNIFKTHESYKKVFFDLISQLAGKNIENKNLIICAEDKSIKEEYENIEDIISSEKEGRSVNLITYGVDVGNYFAKNLKYGDITSFDLYKNLEGEEKLIANLETSLLGRHNVQNIIGVCAMILEKDKEANLVKLKEAIKIFKGIRRRLDLLNEGKTIKVYEGFGSSYEKARAAIEAILLHFPQKNLNIIFEPHTFSWRNADAIAWYDNVFKEARRVFMYQPPSHGATTHTQLTQDQIIDRLVNSKIENKNTNKEQEIFKLNTGGDVDSQFIKSKLTKNTDIVLILSSGDLGGIIKILPSIVD